MGKEVDTKTKTKCIQSGKQSERDDGQIENNPGMFAAE